jgi:hypothetical protein
MKTIECDICEPTKGRYVGGIQLLLSNQGRLISIPEDIERIQPSQKKSTGKYKKKVKSKPIDLVSKNFESRLTDVVNSGETMMMQSADQTAELQEDYRKRLRVERLKRKTLNKDCANIISDPNETDWAKYRSLQ